MEYLRKLTKPEYAKILEIFDQIEQYNFDVIGARFRQIESKLWEIKILNHRVFYVVAEQNEMVILHAYKKQGQKLPRREYDVAIKRMKEVLL